MTKRRKYNRINYVKARKPKFGLNVKTRFKSSKDKEKTGRDDAPVKKRWDKTWTGPGHLTINVREHLQLYQGVIIPGEIQRDYNGTKEGKAQIRVTYQGDSWLRMDARKRGIDWDARSGSKRRNDAQVRALARSVGMPTRTLISALRNGWSSEHAETAVLRGNVPIKGIEVKLGKGGTVVRVTHYDKLDGVMNDLDTLAASIKGLIDA